MTAFHNKAQCNPLLEIRTELEISVVLLVLGGVLGGVLPYSTLIALLDSPDHHRFLLQHTVYPHLFRTYCLVLNQAHSDVVFTKYAHSSSKVEHHVGVVRKHVNTLLNQRISQQAQ